MHTNSSQRKQIRNLLAVLTAAVVAAGGISAWMLYHYNPSGIYGAQNVLLAPQLLGTVQESKRGKVFFEGIQYIYPEGQSEKAISLPKELYEAFYKTIEGEQSLAQVPEDVLASFAKGKLARLILKIQTNGVSETFQEVNFSSSGDYYRIQLRAEGQEGNWLYFYHPQIGQEVHQLLMATQK